jgi:hypothetical protein
MNKTNFELGVQHGEYLGEIIVGFLIISGGGSVIFGAIGACKTAERVVKTYKRINPSSQQLFEDAVNAINDAF